MLSSFSTDYGKSNMEKEKKKGIGNGIYLILLVFTYTQIHKCFYEMVVLLKFELGFEPWKLIEKNKQNNNNKQNNKRILYFCV